MTLAQRARAVLALVGRWILTAVLVVAVVWALAVAVYFILILCVVAGLVHVVRGARG